ncbi:MAG TPA: Mur ligase family protein [Gemmatimonadales bacterium]|nr:Mur ligase family protein [Gemmatimonadales bacterium]
MTTVLDSRRLTGPTILLDRPGAVLDVLLTDSNRERAVAAWRTCVARMLDAVGWGDATLAVRTFEGGASLAFSAPIDALYAATELNEWAWGAATAEMEGAPAPDLAADVEALRARIAEESDPKLVALHDAAAGRQLTFLHDEDGVSVGSGTGVLVWPVDALPDVSSVEWERAHDVPTVLVTGSNGKTTVTRLLAAMVTSAGRVAGTTSTDGVTVRGCSIAEGDYSGPSGARMLLRHPEVETAILETARGGLLRRGLPIERARAAVITNIAEDHLGEFGVDDLAGLAATKLLVARTVDHHGGVVLNADDSILREAGSGLDAPIVWFSLSPASPEVASRVRRGRAALLVDDALVLQVDGTQTVVVPVAEVPVALGGAARHNVANALAAVAAASVLGVTPAQMAVALRAFGRSGEDNPGRANIVDLGGVRLVVDFAHNPHGMAALIGMSRALPADRRLVLVGQAGDRSDAAIRDLARAAMALPPDRVVVKELGDYLRGRAPGEIPGLLADEFAKLGVRPDAISQPGDELASVRDALAWARPGDLLLLTVHENRARVLGLFETLRQSGWQAGAPLP